AGRAVRRDGPRAGPTRTAIVGRAGVPVVARGPIEQRGIARAGPVLAGVARGAGVAVVARRAVRLGGVGWAGGARAVAGLGHVARPRRRPTHRAGVPRRMLAGIARAVAGVGRARVAVVGAGRPVRLLRIRRARGARARAGLRHVAGAGRRAAHGG